MSCDDVCCVMYAVWSSLFVVCCFGVCCLLVVVRCVLCVVCCVLRGAWLLLLHVCCLLVAVYCVMFALYRAVPVCCVLFVVLVGAVRLLSVV